MSKISPHAFLPPVIYFCVRQRQLESLAAEEP